LIILSEKSDKLAYLFWKLLDLDQPRLLTCL